MITIKEPVPFYSASDETHFFQWLQSIPSVKSINGTSNGVEVRFKKRLGYDDLYELIALLTRYDVDQSCLSVLCNKNNEGWFKDKKAFWYKSVFEQSKKSNRRKE